MSSHYGIYGGQYIAETLMPTLIELEQEYRKAQADPAFQQELNSLLTDYVGRESPLYYARRLSEAVGGAKIYLKREDLNHTGAHKINNTLGQALLARRMGKSRLIAETGAGQHGVALATAAAYFGLECEIHMGEVDIAKQAPNVTRMKILGAKVVPVSFGLKTLKEAVDSAFESYAKNYKDSIYCIGSVLGPHPFPLMVRDFQFCIGEESREQFKSMTGQLPDAVCACVGGGSNAAGSFAAYLNDRPLRGGTARTRFETRGSRRDAVLRGSGFDARFRQLHAQRRRWRTGSGLLDRLGAGLSVGRSRARLLEGSRPGHLHHLHR